MARKKTTPVEEKEEWIWIEGYKGTDKDMKCRDYQFELGKRFDMPDEVPIIKCISGFHLCRNLRDVFPFYSLEDGNRFFKVRALIQKNKPLSFDEQMAASMRSLWDESSPYQPPKSVAKSIEFISGVSTDELYDEWMRVAEVAIHSTKLPTRKQFERVRQIGFNAWKKECEAKKHAAKVKKLVKLGYSDGFARVIVECDDLYDRAVKIGEATELSCDMKAAYILFNVKEK